MKRFRFLANTVLEAEDLDDCFEKLAKHFKTPSESELEHEGTISIKLEE